MKDTNENKIIEFKGTRKDHEYSEIPVSPDLECWGYYIIITFAMIFVAVVVFVLAKNEYRVSFGIISVLIIFFSLPIVVAISQKLGIRSYDKRIEKFYREHVNNKSDEQTDR